MHILRATYCRVACMIVFYFANFSYFSPILFGANNMVFHLSVFCVFLCFITVAEGYSVYAGEIYGPHFISNLGE